MADEKARAAAAKEVEKIQKADFDEWVKQQEAMGYKVIGDSFANAQVVGLDDGPTYDDTPGS